MANSLTFARVNARGCPSHPRYHPRPLIHFRDSLTATTYRGGRLFIVASGLTFFWQRHHVIDDVDLVGLETSISVPPMPLVKTPTLQFTAGVAQLWAGRKVRGVGGRAVAA